MRYQLRTTDLPTQMRKLGFVAWVHDTRHPDDPVEGCSVSWHQDETDARRTCDALNHVSVHHHSAVPAEPNDKVLTFLETFVGAQPGDDYRQYVSDEVLRRMGKSALASLSDRV